LDQQADERLTIMNILIADDNAVVRRGLREILSESISEACISEAGDGDEALGLLAKSDFAILLLDINMPGHSGLDVLLEVKSTYPRLPVIIVSVQPEDQYAVRCLSAGAAAYINKDRAPEILAETITAVLNGTCYANSVFAESLVTVGNELKFKSS
jgi:DNA-binding NarL/FixJ family response regulator